KVQAVVGGDWVSDIKLYNHVAGLFYFGKFGCGATIISERRVATDTNQYDITRYVKPEDIMIHPNYTKGVFHHDIAVLEFEEPLDFTNPKIGKAELVPENYVPLDGEAVIVLGFTQFDEEHKQIAYSKLRYVPASVKDFAKCKEETASRVLESGRRNFNQGDSGGPLVTRDGRYLGIVSNALNSIVEVSMNVGAYHTFLNNPR
ncbi:transmembrane protease serine 11B-like protein, partial [Sitodiplosis mosellana]|uniref:transmembrane protease serine 11B-like protein n=1 Tax=Sitodiplosis mosellana TaxID=263140 RepID=UPI00244404A3